MEWTELTLCEESTKRLGDVMVDIARKRNKEIDNSNYSDQKYTYALMEIKRALLAIRIHSGFERSDDFKYTCVTIENYRFDV